MLTSNFKGKDFPPGTKVQFTHSDGQVYRGKVMRMLKTSARVATTDGRVFKVSYSLMTLLSKPAYNMSADEVEQKAKELMRVHKLHDWRFQFDLAPARGGRCSYTHKVIQLSMSYALKAEPDEVINTILHEIAHALVGPNQGHNFVWRRMAQSIGCTGDRCHTVNHTESKYVGQCGCDGYVWKRDRLTRKSTQGQCTTCGHHVEWSLRQIDENDFGVNPDEQPVVHTKPAPKNDLESSHNDILNALDML